MKISSFPFSAWLVLLISGGSSTMATSAATGRQQDSLDKIGNGDELSHRHPSGRYPPRLRQGLASSTYGRHEQRLLVDEVEAAAAVVGLQDDSEDELDLTSVICHIVEYDVQFVETEEDGDRGNNQDDDDDEIPLHACFTDDSLMASSTGSRYGDQSGDQVYNIIVPPETLALLSLDDDNKSFISISKAIVNHARATIEIVADAIVSMVEPPASFARRLGRRQLSKATGNNIILVLRVNYRGVKPDFTASKLEGIFFGQGADKVAVSLSSQMEACSFGKLRYLAAQGDGILGGVADIYIPESVGGDVQVLENLVLKQFNAAFDDDFKDSLSNVVMVMPKDNLQIKGRNWLGK
jgi:hypothetical protein